MSEPKLISPMLDNFVMGDPISAHHGVQCCPAMEKDTDERYIVKVISVPASQRQLEALLLTGAYQNEEDARSYFLELANGIVEEVDILKKLSRLEGFLPYRDCQLVPMEHEVGYDVYLISPYKRSLERFFKKGVMTHLAAVNLGLDMCASLAVCRHAGYLYVDLKPDNIFISEDQEYRIGDLGFVKLDSLNYASLPDKYRSAYTAPEIADAFSSISTTADIYAAGMILYQAYNGGTLPEQAQPGEAFLAPAYADYEMAEIILKACDPDPEKRWQDPIQMGQALVSYMQRNGANDTPIVPSPVELPEEPFAEDEPIVDEQTLEAEVADSNQTAEDQIVLDGFSEEADAEELTEDAPADAEESAQSDEEDALLNLNFLDALSDDDTAPQEDMAEDIEYEELPEELGEILAQADELIAHDAPAPVVVPEAIDVPIPEPVLEEQEADAEEEAATSDDAEEAPVEEIEQAEADEAEEDEDADYEDEYEEGYEPIDKKTVNKFIAALIALILLAGLAFGGYYFYTNYYLKTVEELVLDGSGDTLRVSVTSDVDPKMLTVVCTDTHGIRKTLPLTDGEAVFTQLSSNTFYSVTVEISGLHKLTGDISDSYATPKQTNIVQFNAVTGSDAGTAILSFTVDGADAALWTLTCSAEGEEDRIESFTGHVFTLSGLTEGTAYTLKLSADEELFMTGTTQIQYTAVQPVAPEDLAVSAASIDSVNVSWKCPEDAIVEEWIVRCYSDSGFDQTVTVTATEAGFTGLDLTKAHTIEVTAKGMNSGERYYISENSVLVNAASQLTGGQAIELTWEDGNSGASQWLVIYSIDGGSQTILRSESTSATISPIIPGSVYQISIQLEDGTTVIGGELTVEVPDADNFEGYLLSTETITYEMCKTPSKKNWDRYDLKKSDYTTKFKVGVDASFLLNSGRTYKTSGDTITRLFVIRDADGNLVSAESTQSSWTNMWHKRYCELDIPSMPEAPGSYTVAVYFNGQFVLEQAFEITD